MHTEDDGLAHWIAWHVLGLPTHQWEREFERLLGDYVGRLRADHPEMGPAEIEAKARALVARVFDLAEQLTDHGDGGTGGRA